MDAEAIQDIFEPSGPVQIRRMFGAHGIYRAGRIIAIEDEGMIWLKADQRSQPAFEAAGSRAFSYTKKTGDVSVMGYWLLPEPAFDDPDVLRHWVKLAEEAALRAEAAKPKKQPRSAPRKRPTKG